MGTYARQENSLPKTQFASSMRKRSTRYLKKPELQLLSTANVSSKSLYLLEGISQFTVTLLLQQFSL